MRRNINTCRVEGYVFDSSKLAVRETGENSKNPGTTYIAGDLDIAIDEEGLNIVSVHFTYVTKFYSRSGKANNTFTNLMRIIDEPHRTWLEAGKAEAFKVRVDGSLALNDFVSSDGKMISAKRCEGSFLTIVNNLGKGNDRNTFSLDMVINRVVHIEADPEKNIKDDYVVLGGAAFNFRNDLLPIELVVKSKEGMKYFESIDVDSEPLYTKVWGKINSYTDTVDREEGSAFGDAQVISYTRKVREWAVTGAAKIPYEYGEEDVLTEEELTAAIQNREVYLAEVKQRNDEYLASKNNEKKTVEKINNASVKKGKFNF